MIKMDIKPITVRGDSTLLLDETLGGDAIRDEITQIAVLEEDAHPIATYRLTRDSIWRGLGNGLSLDGITGLLQKYSRHELPQNVVFEISEYAAHMGRATLTYENGELRLKSTDHKILELVAGKFSEENVKQSDDGLVIRPSRCKNVIRFLASKGCPVSDQANSENFKFVPITKKHREANLTHEIFQGLQGMQTAWNGELVNDDEGLEAVICRFEDDIEKRFAEFGELASGWYELELKHRFGAANKSIRRKVGFGRESLNKGVLYIRFASSEDFVKNAGEQDLHDYVVARWKEFLNKPNITGDYYYRNIVVPFLYHLDYKLLSPDEFETHYVIPKGLFVDRFTGFSNVHIGGRMRVTLDQDASPPKLAEEWETDVKGKLGKWKKYLPAEHLEIAKLRYENGLTYPQLRQKLRGERSQELHEELIYILDFFDEHPEYAENKEDAKFLADFQESTGFEAEDCLKIAKLLGRDYMHETDVITALGIIRFDELTLQGISGISLQEVDGENYVLVSSKAFKETIRTRMPANRLIIKDDLTVLVDLITSGREDLEDKVAEIAECEEESDAYGHYRITKESIWTAITEGKTIDKILKFLKQNSRFRLPDKLDAELRDYAKSLRDTTITYEDREFVLKSSKKNVLAAVRAQYKDYNLIQEREDGTFCIHPSRIELLKKFLAKQGLPVTDLSRHKDYNFRNASEVSKRYILSAYAIIGINGPITAWYDTLIDDDKNIVDDAVSKFENEIREMMRVYGTRLESEYLDILKLRFGVTSQVDKHEYKRIGSYKADNALRALFFASNEDFAENAGKRDLKEYVIEQYREYYGEGSPLLFKEVIVPILIDLDYPLLLKEDIYVHFSLPDMPIRSLENNFKGKYIRAIDGRWKEVVNVEDIEDRIKKFEEETRQKLEEFDEFLTDEQREAAKIRYLGNLSYKQIRKKLEGKEETHKSLIGLLQYLSENRDYAKKAKKKGMDIFSYLETNSELDIDARLKLCEAAGHFYEDIGEVRERYFIQRGILAMIEGIEIVEDNNGDAYIHHTGNIVKAIEDFEIRMRKLIAKHGEALNETQLDVVNARYAVPDRKMGVRKRKFNQGIAGVPANESELYLKNTIEFLQKIEETDYLTEYQKNGKGKGLLTYLREDAGFVQQGAVRLARRLGWRYEPEEKVLKEHGLEWLDLDNVPAIWKEMHAGENYILVSDKATKRALKDLSRPYLSKKRQRLET